MNEEREITFQDVWDFLPKEQRYFNPDFKDHMNICFLEWTVTEDKSIKGSIWKDPKGMKALKHALFNETNPKYKTLK